MGAVDVSYEVEEGETLHAGRPPAQDGWPLWRQNAPLDAWIEVPGSEGAGGAELQEYSSFTMVGMKAYAQRCGGHSYPDNRTTMIDLGVDTPTGWQLMDPPSPSSAFVINASHYLDGKPTSHHNRFLVHYVAEIGNQGSIFHAGVKDAYGNQSFTSGSVDRYDIETDTWDPPGTWANMGLGNDGGSFRDPAGDIWVKTHRFSLATNSWAMNALTAQPEWSPRYPWATAEDYVFGLQWGDGWGGSAGLGILACRQRGTVREQITFNASAATAAFLSEPNLESGMCYVPDWGAFFYHSGINGSSYFKAIPNESTVFDMEIANFGNAPVFGSGVQNRLQYCAALGGILAHNKQTYTGKFYFLATQ